ncbi:helix-turn-helix domain-containing protein [Pseudonocardia kunmingensis]|uniref:Helix-turn-helix protein n=1 Tax=Pseudonocardia kunmingensis TaxID=630975 RepID=A0A543E0Z5_9PSEU|nr:helix-turn-helix transcriptional regulator [Pseudonocardia kunmingensis]TQM15247.1 helix-turn-helix protein [Pseudonocardia kunmingensis]
MTGRNGAVVRRMQLGRVLRELREQAGLSLEVAAPALDWSSSKLSRIENGHQGIDVHGVRSMLDLYEVGGERWTELIELTRAVARKGWWRAYGLDDTGYVPLEAEATSVRDVTIGFVPGLLQTPDYAKAIFTSRLRPYAPSELSNAVAARTVRQQRLVRDDDPLTLIALVDEAVLRRPVGGPDVMRAQCAHLVASAGIDRVTLRVLPAGLGAASAMAAGFTLLSFAGIGAPDIAYVEHPFGSVRTDKESDVARAAARFDRLYAIALTSDESVALIQRVAAET